MPIATKYNTNECTGWCQLFVPKIRGNFKKLNEEHHTFLNNLMNDDLSINVEQAFEQLISRFDALQIGKSAVHNFITKNMGF
ncbi:hypothetical protein A0J61_05877 [Choanephora cucurbitarum]|uniref:Uncharacterized protein n=1 Tax=Choanephora cucurbitarum TaxID=101091 RepID=A0A1C7NAD3_9FUNG|nr:hypothetical protein A0J61_05877 [Choanephora cucurbitarum]